MTPWEQVEAHYPLCNPDIKLLKEQLVGVVGVIMMVEAIRTRPIHAPQLETSNEPLQQRTIQHPEVLDHMGD